MPEQYTATGGVSLFSRSFALVVPKGLKPIRVPSALIADYGFNVTLRNLRVGDVMNLSYTSDEDKPYSVATEIHAIFRGSDNLEIKPLSSGEVSFGKVLFFKKESGLIEVTGASNAPNYYFHKDDVVSTDDLKTGDFVTFTVSEPDRRGRLRALKIELSESVSPLR